MGLHHDAVLTGQGDIREGFGGPEEPPGGGDVPLEVRPLQGEELGWRRHGWLALGDRMAKLHTWPTSFYFIGTFFNKESLL